MPTLILPYDTETSGLPRYKDPSDHPDQPHLVQLAACLLDVTARKVVAHMDVIIKPDGWLIPVEASNLHGITTEKAYDVGIPEEEALAMFMAMWDIKGEQCSRLGFNEPFDARIMRIAQKRNPKLVSESLLNDWKVGRAECAMRMARPLCGLPKNPKLAEAFEHFTGQTLPNAHSALGDMLGAVTVYFACIDNTPAGKAVPFTLSPADTPAAEAVAA